MKVHEAIHILETMPAGADVNVIALEAAVERTKAIKKREVEEMLAVKATKAKGYESFLKPHMYVQSVYVDNPREVNFEDVYNYAYVDCGGYFDVYKTGVKEVNVEVIVGNTYGGNC